MADYCTADNVKGNGRLDIDVSGYDTDISTMITGVSRRIDRHYGVVDDSFAQATDATRYFTEDAVFAKEYERHHQRQPTYRFGVINQVLVLDMPIVSVTSITNGDADSTAVTLYRLQPRNGRWYNEIHLLSTAPDGWEFDDDGEIAVTGKWGFSTTVPDEIREACAYWVAYLFKRYQAGLQDANANFDLGSVVYTEGMPKLVKAMLPTYRVGVG